MERRCKMCGGDLGYRDREVFRFESIDCPLIDQTGVIVALVGVIERMPE